MRTRLLPKGKKEEMKEDFSFLVRKKRGMKRKGDYEEGGRKIKRVQGKVLRR